MRGAGTPCLAFAPVRKRGTRAEKEGGEKEKGTVNSLAHRSASRLCRQNLVLVLDINRSCNKESFTGFPGGQRLFELHLGLWYRK